ncbi:hypothetical protein CVT24_003760, partial [Panaeolus cyanescens]
ALDAPGAASSSSSNQAAYLLEEVISDDVPFIKYIHNGKAVPVPKENEEDYEVAVFLCFIQHVQYVATHGQVFISDFQGAGNLLTDPQVMTHPELIDPSSTFDHSLFGEGNVDSAFLSFVDQHECNEYCDFLNLPPVWEVVAVESEVKEQKKKGK